MAKVIDDYFLYSETDDGKRGEPYGRKIVMLMDNGLNRKFDVNIHSTDAEVLDFLKEQLRKIKAVGDQDRETGLVGQEIKQDG